MQPHVFPKTTPQKFPHNQIDTGYIIIPANCHRRKYNTIL